MQTAAQVTPEQLIVAGRRAEQQGQIGYALQFYRYLAEKYPNTAEAFEARDALFRLHAADGQAQAQQPQSQPQSHSQRPAAPSQRPRPVAPVEQPPPPRAAPSELSVSSHDRSTPGERPARRAAPHRDLDGARGYRTGRFVAAILSTLGWLLLLLSVLGAGGLGVVLTVTAAPRALHELAAANLLFAIAGLAGALFLGLLAVFAGQLARATFDNADLTRWMAAVLTHDHEHHG
jgi:hypothetical protein